MDGIFNLFGDNQFGKPNSTLIANKNSQGTPLNTLTPLSRSKSSIVSPVRIARQLGTKPKGLSLRSKSDLNVPGSGVASNVFPSSFKPSINRESSNLKLTQFDIGAHAISISPSKSRKTATKKPNTDPIEIKGLSPKKKSLNNRITPSQKFTNQRDFKKPVTPKSEEMRDWPEPEGLAHYYDFEHEMNNYDIPLRNEFSKLILESNVKHYEDEGFESEPEEMPSPSIPKCSFDELMEDENEIDGGLDLPDISEENEF